MTTRRTLLLSLAGVACAPSLLHAQTARKVRRVGIMLGGTPTVYAKQAIGEFISGMSALGNVEGKDYVVEARYAEGHYDRYPVMAREFVQLSVDAIVSIAGTNAALAARDVTHSILIVMASGGDPQRIGLVKNLARPEGNVTGLTNVTTDIAPKYVELLRESIAQLSGVAVLFNPDSATEARYFAKVESVAKTHGITVFHAAAKSGSHVEQAFREKSSWNADALIVVPDPLFNSMPQLIADLALKHRLPSIGPMRRYVEAGLLLCYGQDIFEGYRRAAYHIDRLFKGAKVSELPVEQPTKFELWVNLKTAKALGLTIPQSILMRADKVIQ